MKRIPIRNAYDAYWFLHDHPRLNCPEMILTEQPAKSRHVNLRVLRETDLSGQPTGRKFTVEQFRSLHRRAIECNLDIHYAKVDDSRRVNDDPLKNHITECWLECGPVYYVINDGKLRLEHAHDIRLDCGGETFDAALVNLARLVRRHYGDWRASR